MEIARFVLGFGVAVVSVIYMAIPIVIAMSLINIARSLREINSNGIAQRPYIEDATARTQKAPMVR